MSLLPFSLPALLYSYIGITVVFFAIDLIWLGLVAKGVYRKYLDPLLLDEFNWVAALIFYFIFLLGLMIFAIVPSVEKGSLLAAVVLGGLFGFFCYATYDLTNLATLKNWPWQIVIIDMIWGTVLSATVATAGFYITRFFTGV